jgi:hypothetical protein
MTITGGTTGTGTASVTYAVAANTAVADRAGTMTMAGNTFTLTQAGVGCTFTLSSTAASMALAGGTGSVNVTGPGSCTWSAVSNASWITVTSGASGSGGGTVGYSVASNSGQSRSGTVTIAGITFTVTQGGTACTYSVSPNNLTVGSAAGSSTVTMTTGASCTWTAASDSAWAVVGSGTGRTGSGTFTVTVSANSGSARHGTITVASSTVSVTQNAGGGPQAPGNLRIVQ